MEMMGEEGGAGEEIPPFHTDALFCVDVINLRELFKMYIHCL